MIRFSGIILLIIHTCNGVVYAQEGNVFSGTIIDAVSKQPLNGTSISVYTAGRIRGTVSNRDGVFLLHIPEIFDSLKFSIIGYRSVVFLPGKLPAGNGKITMDREAVFLEEVTVHPQKAVDIIKAAVRKLDAEKNDSDFQSNGFYREIIRDREKYFSVAEALVSCQFSPLKHSYKIKLERGRSKEEVAYTRMFEDFHPSGGPQTAAEQEPSIIRPAFLDAAKLSLFNFKMDSILRLDELVIYRISFDQLPGVKEALEKGYVYVEKESAALLKYEAVNSPVGTPYIKSLTGTDKVFAGLLKIDFKRKGWKRQVDFVHVGNKWLLHHATVEYDIAYRQPKKSIDLDLSINIELLMEEAGLPIKQPISKEEEWKRKNMAMNLPVAFDREFWGSNNVIEPTKQLSAIIQSLIKDDSAQIHHTAIKDWRSMNSQLFLSGETENKIVMAPLMRGAWEDDNTAAMLYRDMEGDFSIETNLNLTKSTDSLAVPSNGFQQAGIIIRASDSSSENNISLSIGTGGNSNPKFFFKRTLNSKTKAIVESIDSMSGWLKLVKTGDTITAFTKIGTVADWKKTASYIMKVPVVHFQVGMIVSTSFPGNGPKMHPDMRAAFTDTKILQ